MGGYGVCMFTKALCRWSKGVHDPLYATALYFQKGDRAVVLIVADLVGLVGPDLNDIRRRTSDNLSIPYENVIVASTHTHASPDMIGLWGSILPPDSGRDKSYAAFMRAKAVRAAVMAYENREEASLSYAVGTQDALHYNTYQKQISDPYIDHTITVLKATSPDGRVVATLTNWGCHPTTEGMQNRLFSSDYVGAFYKEMSAGMDGIHMFVNGSIGAAIQPDPAWRRKHVEGDGQGFRWADAMGETLATQVKDMMGNAKPVSFDTMEIHSTSIDATMMNGLYRFAGNIGLFPFEIPEVGDKISAELTAVVMGPVRFGSMPGELSPQLGEAIRAELGGEAQVLVGLSQEYLGYVLDREQYDNAMYAYEKMLCVGPDYGEAIVEGYRRMNIKSR